jgi:hypothetical protein
MSQEAIYGLVNACIGDTPHHPLLRQLPDAGIPERPQERHRRSGRGAAQPEEQPEASRTRSKEEVACGDYPRCESAGTSGPAKAARQVFSVLYAYFFP